jgi:hypothetical protein
VQEIGLRFIDIFRAVENIHKSVGIAFFCVMGNRLLNLRGLLIIIHIKAGFF